MQCIAWRPTSWPRLRAWQYASRPAFAHEPNGECALPSELSLHPLCNRRVTPVVIAQMWQRAIGRTAASSRREPQTADDAWQGNLAAYVGKTRNYPHQPCCGHAAGLSRAAGARVRAATLACRPRRLFNPEAPASAEASASSLDNVVHILSAMMIPPSFVMEPICRKHKARRIRHSGRMD